MPAERRRVGVLEDDLVMGESLVQRLHLEGYDPVWWQSGAQALSAIASRRPALMICDLRLPDVNGDEVFRRVRPSLGGVPVLFMTAYADIDEAVRLMRDGADDYITKPFEMDEFLKRIDHLLKGAEDSDSATGELGRSKSMRAVETLLRRVADIDSTVLLMGESGVGKEVAARFLHRTSARADAPFVAVNCAAIPETLIESELFGHEKGAFTGAANRHLGYAERARDGILFLDEVGDLPLSMQAKLLRLIQERQFNRVGGEAPVAFTARILCATNSDLERAVAERTFREDLFYRLNVIPVMIPPLRDRADDIPGLIEHFAGVFARAFGVDLAGASGSAVDAALAHDWPGNVRELQNRVERAVALAAGSSLRAADLFPEAPAEEDGTGSGTVSLSAIRRDAEARHIRAVLGETDGQVGEAARRLGVSRTTLWEKMRRYGID